MTRPTPAPDFLALETVATLLSVSVRQVHRLRDAGELVGVRIGRRVVIPRQSYEAYRQQLHREAWTPAPIALPTRGRPRHPAAPTAPREGAR